MIVNMSKPLLTEKQAAVYKFLVTTMSNSIPPSVREICTATKIKSTSTVHAILKTLEEYGYIRRDPHFSRAIRIENAAGSTSVPVLGKVTAGSPILAFEDISEYIPYPSN
ncbi:MAG: helix-turn-helix domain-containing protein, partial [bacterium]|nr:helix-turn-helix domain-containing protein [bacterium]